MDINERAEQIVFEILPKGGEVAQKHYAEIFARHLREAVIEAYEDAAKMACPICANGHGVSIVGNLVLHFSVGGPASCGAKDIHARIATLREEGSTE